MTKKNPDFFVLQPGTLHEFGGTKIIAREVSAQGNELRGVLLWIADEVDGGFLNGQAIFAKFVLLKSSQNGDSRLVLTNGVTLQASRATEGRTTRFQTFQTIIRKNSLVTQQDIPQPAEMPTRQLIALAVKREGGGTIAPNAVEELHNRLAYPAPCLALGLLAVPLALMGQRFSRAANGQAAATSVDFLVSNASGTENHSSVVVNLMSA